MWKEFCKSESTYAIDKIICGVATNPRNVFRYVCGTRFLLALPQPNGIVN